MIGEQIVAVFEATDSPDHWPSFFLRTNLSQYLVFPEAAQRCQIPSHATKLRLSCTGRTVHEIRGEGVGGDPADQLTAISLTDGSILLFFFAFDPETLQLWPTARSDSHEQLSRWEYEFNALPLITLTKTA